MILIIDDQEKWISTYVDELEFEGFRTIVVPEVDEALKFLREGSREVDLVVLDVMLPPGRSFADIDTAEGRRTGVPLAKLLRDSYPDLPLVALTNVRGPSLLEIEPYCLRVYRKAEVDAVEFAADVRGLLARPGNS